ncbi:MAG: hypothetical protein Q8M19_26225 [Reyranella sp.]|nr:hypothetical protein [Reyranella sp.]
MTMALLISSSDVLADTEWKVIGSPGVFRLEFPYSPVCTKSEVKTGAGVPVPWQICMIEKDGMVLGIQTGVFPPNSDVRPALEGAVEAAVQHLKNDKWDRVISTPYQGNDAVEAVGVGKDASKHRMRCVVVGQRVYIMWGFVTPARSAELDRFINSLHLQ